MSENFKKECHLRDLTPEEYSKIRFRTPLKEYLELIEEFRKLGKPVKKVETNRPNAVYQALRRTTQRYNITDIQVRCLDRGVVLGTKEYFEEMTKP